MAMYVDSETLELMQRLRLKCNQNCHATLPYASSYLEITECGIWSYHLGYADITTSPRSLDGSVKPNKGLTDALNSLLLERVREMRGQQIPCTIVGRDCGLLEKLVGLLKDVEEALEKQRQE